MKKILIVEDNQDMAILVTQITNMVVPNATIIHTASSEEAIPKIEWADLVISDFDFPTEGFLGLLPTLQKTSRPFILQTAEPDNIKVYDPMLQLAAIRKGADFVPQMMSVLRSI